MLQIDFAVSFEHVIAFWQICVDYKHPKSVLVNI